jgi:hypothetical protein
VFKKLNAQLDNVTEAVKAYDAVVHGKRRGK